MCRSLSRLPPIDETAEAGSRPNIKSFPPIFKVLSFQNQVDEPWEKNIRIQESDDEDPTWWMRYPEVQNKKSIRSYMS